MYEYMCHIDIYDTYIHTHAHTDYTIYYTIYTIYGIMVPYQYFVYNIKLIDVYVNSAPLFCFSPELC